MKKNEKKNKIEYDLFELCNNAFQHILEKKKMRARLQRIAWVLKEIQLFIFSFFSIANFIFIKHI